NCIEGWYGEKCDTPCSEFCAGCDQTSGKCTACVGGNRRSGEMCDQCPQCLNNQCHVNGTCKVSCADKTQHGDNCDIPCSVTIKDCVECESVNNNALCSKCVDGLYGSRCMEKCPDNCESCDNDTLCTECMKGYSGPTCSAICKHDHCSHCNVSGDCLKCEKGFFYEKYQKKICVSCTNITELSNCYDCESYVKCIECQPGFYLKSANQCEKCPDHCLECSSESTCSKCELEWSGVSCKCGPYCNQTSTLADWCIETNGSCTKGCSGENYTSTCDKHCPGIDCLVCTQNDGQCLQCVSGKYGQYTSCSDNCGHCLDGICDIRDGTCKGACHNTYHGDKCNQTCPANCNSTDCIQSTGACFGCIGGFFGDKCDQTCPANCNSTDCKQSTGACSGCKKGFFGDKCDQECNANCLDSNFVHGCQQQDGNCKNCKPGFYGDKCEQKCNPKCRYDGGASGCRKSDGRCHSCEDGYYSLSCELNCSANCISKCDKDSGHCFGCKSVFYGPFCNKSCPNNCAMNCDQDSGKCFGCKPGSYGFKCTDICSRTCAVEGSVADCAQDDGTWFCSRQDGEKGVGPCDQMTGVCIHNCQPGYHSDTCNIRCNDRCNGTLCNRITAECLNGCVDGFSGTNCAKSKFYIYY
ncbi:TENX-like protein, partial [Mya arenaria]